MSARLCSGSFGFRIAAEATERLAMAVVSFPPRHITATGSSKLNKYVNFD
jgi:hypothetical protein